MNRLPRHRLVGWSRPQRGVLMFLLAAMLVWLGIRLVLNPIYVADPQPLWPARAGELEDRIDPNIADWHTLAALPVIGEKRARQIVAFRESYLAANPGSQAFQQPQDLLRIKGIGPAMLAQIEPYLIFASTTQPASTLPASAPSGG
ncbi:MAG TPA: helix-hairpin-helix domain-containing protein [Tepidisphaeraceae bacterium]|nr:helix-hairpin-helix domain-containing protein [Tepidisphaeraceae bacterium]